MYVLLFWFADFAVGSGFGSRLEACSLSATRCYKVSPGTLKALGSRSDIFDILKTRVQPPNSFTIFHNSVTRCYLWEVANHGRFAFRILSISRSQRTPPPRILQNPATWSRSDQFQDVSLGSSHFGRLRSTDVNPMNLNKILILI